VFARLPVVHLRIVGNGASPWACAPALTEGAADKARARRSFLAELLTGPHRPYVCQPVRQALGPTPGERQEPATSGIRSESPAMTGQARRAGREAPAARKVPIGCSP